MKYIFFASVFSVATLLVTGALAQHEGHNAPPADKSAAQPVAPDTKDEMKGGMMAEHAAVAKLADQLVAGFTAIENEKDPAALKAKLAEHGKLLKELQAKLLAPAQKMESMKGKMMGGGKKQ